MRRSLSTLKKLRSISSALRQKQTAKKLGDSQIMEKSQQLKMEEITSSTELNYNELLIIPTENKITVAIKGEVFTAKVTKEYLLSKAQEFLKRGIFSDN